MQDTMTPNRVRLMVESIMHAVEGKIAAVGSVTRSSSNPGFLPLMDRNVL